MSYSYFGSILIQWVHFNNILTLVRDGWCKPLHFRYEPLHFRYKPLQTVTVRVRVRVKLKLGLGLAHSFTHSPQILDQS